MNFSFLLTIFLLQRGSVPHLTKDVLKLVTTNEHFLNAPLPSTILMNESIEQTGIDCLASFVGLKVTLKKFVYLYFTT